MNVTDERVRRLEEAKRINDEDGMPKGMDAPQGGHAVRVIGEDSSGHEYFKNDWPDSSDREEVNPNACDDESVPESCPDIDYHYQTFSESYDALQILLYAMDLMYGKPSTTLLRSTLETLQTSVNNVATIGAEEWRVKLRLKALCDQLQVDYAATLVASNKAQLRALDMAANPESLPEAGATIEAANAELDVYKRFICDHVAHGNLNARAAAAARGRATKAYTKQYGSTLRRLTPKQV